MKKLRITFAFALVTLQFVPQAIPFDLDAHGLIAKYKLMSGRQSACPASIAYMSISPSERIIPASQCRADSSECFGKGGTVIQNVKVLSSQGLRLPNLVMRGGIDFFAGVESSPRICGPWTFNTSAVSWFVYNNGLQTRQDSDSSTKLEPGYIYLMFEHFSDFCMFRANVDQDAASPLDTKEPDPTAELELPIDNPETELFGNDESDAGSIDSPEDSDSESACFPANATVQLETGEILFVEQLKVGDRVLSSVEGEFSEVFLFSHENQNIVSEFVELRTERKTLHLTAGHFLYTNGHAKAGGTAAVGDYVTTGFRKNETIVHIQLVRKRGLYNPHTMTGNLVVNGVLVTTWTATVQASVASAMLLPFRFQQILPFSCFHSAKLSLGSVIFDILRSALNTASKIFEQL